MIRFLLLMLPAMVIAATPATEGSLLSWEYTARADLRGFECSAGGSVIGQAGPRSRSMRLRLEDGDGQTVSCRAISSDSALHSDPATIEDVDYDASPTVAAPTMFCVVDGDELSWDYSGIAKEFVVTVNGSRVGVAGPSAVTMPAPALSSGSHTVGIRAVSAIGATSAVVEVVRTYPESGVVCDE